MHIVYIESSIFFFSFPFLRSKSYIARTYTLFITLHFYQFYFFPSRVELFRMKEVFPLRTELSEWMNTLRQPERLLSEMLMDDLTKV